MEDKIQTASLPDTGPDAPWEYRPKKHDDWGWIRNSNGALIALARCDQPCSQEEFDAHRQAGTDPYEKTGRLIVDAVNSKSGPRFFDAIKLLHEAHDVIEAIDSECLLTGQLKDLVDAILVHRRAVPQTDQINPHIYTPDYQTMGDCRVCGHEQNKPWHLGSQTHRTCPHVDKYHNPSEPCQICGALGPWFDSCERVPSKHEAS